MELDKIWGVGPATARSLVEQGYTSVAHLRAAMHALLPPPPVPPVSEAGVEKEKRVQPQQVEEEGGDDDDAVSGLLACAPTLPPRCPLTVQQMIGLNRYEDLLERMDREEVRRRQEWVHGPHLLC
mgnify:CR=1 FL=1